MKKILVLLVLATLLISCSGNEKKEIMVEGNTMGTYYRVKAFASNDPKELKREIEKFFKLFNDIFSTYIAASELSKINHGKYLEYKISDTLIKVLNVATEVSKKSDGYFDVTVGPLVNAWGFGPNSVQKIPSSKKLAEVKKQVGYINYTVDENILKLKKRPIYIDLSAIAKGFGVDELIKFLEYRGIGDMLVEIGGEVRTRGVKKDGSRWTIGIEGPSLKLGSKLQKVVHMDNMAMATSGSYRNFKKYGEKVFQHTIDPITAAPAKHKTISVSVLHEKCLYADAWATALMSLGHKKGLEIAKRNDIKALFQVKEGSVIKIYETNTFKKYISRIK